LLGILSRFGAGGGESMGRRTWRKYFEARVAVMAEWYGISREEVLGLIAGKMREGFKGDAVFDAVKDHLEGRGTRILERT